MDAERASAKLDLLNEIRLPNKIQLSYHMTRESARFDRMLLALTAKVLIETLSLLLPLTTLLCRTATTGTVTKLC